MFELKYKIIYKGKEYDPFSIGELIIDRGEITIFCSDYEDYESNDFIKVEQFVFQKLVSLDEIDAIVEVIEPILEFNEFPKERKVIPSSQIEKYFRQF